MILWHDSDWGLYCEGNLVDNECGAFCKVQYQNFSIGVEEDAEKNEKLFIWVEFKTKSLTNWLIIISNNSNCGAVQCYRVGKLTIRH